MIGYEISDPELVTHVSGLEKTELAQLASRAMVDMVEQKQIRPLEQVVLRRTAEGNHMLQQYEQSGILPTSL